MCSRTVWAPSFQNPTRLLYSREAIEIAQNCGVVQMWEPRDVFPTFDRSRRVFKDWFGLPELFFSRAAIGVLLKYMRFGEEWDSTWIEPVFSE